jgi:cyanophycinase-like exopeptidase
VARRRWVLAVLGAVLAGWILGGEWVSIHRQVPESHLIDALVGLSFLAAGLMALDRRPRNAMGRLMMAYVAVYSIANWG